MGDKLARFKSSAVRETRELRRIMRSLTTYSKKKHKQIGGFNELKISKDMFLKR